MRLVRFFVVLGLGVVAFSAAMALLLVMASSNGTWWGTPAVSFDENMAKFPAIFGVFLVASVGAIWYKNRGNWF